MQAAELGPIRAGSFFISRPPAQKSTGLRPCLGKGIRFLRSDQGSSAAAGELSRLRD